MAMGTWTWFPFVTSVFLAAMLHCQIHSDENYQEQSPNGMFCSPVCKDDDSLKGETFHCVLFGEENDYKFIARNLEGERWRFYRTDLDFDSNLLCQIAGDGEKFAVNKSRRKCSSSFGSKSRGTYDYMNSDFIPDIMKEILASEQSGNSVPSSRKSNLAVSASGPGSFAQASDGRESIFASGNKKPSAQTSGNAHAFSSDGKINAESHFGKDFTYPATGRPTGGRPKDDFMLPFFNSFQQQQPSYPIHGNGLASKKPDTNYPRQSPGQNSFPFDDVFNSVGLGNPFFMLSGQPPTYNGNRNLHQGQNPRLYQPRPIDSLFPPEFAVAFLPYLGPYLPPYEAPLRFRDCYPRCKREAIDSALEDDGSEENLSNLGEDFSYEICSKIETAICSKRKIIYCKENERCCWENVNVDMCDEEQIELSTQCYTRLSTILGI